MNRSITYHRSFILRIRNDETDAHKQPCWRYVLLDPERDLRRGFTSMDQLFAALALEISDDTATGRTQSEIVCEVETFLNDRQSI